MTTYRFDGRVAVVTGAGRGIGAAHARLLAARGAQVVVNDLGASIRGDGTDADVAAAVAEAIVASGGTAVPDGHDVSTAAGAQALVDAAVARFGRVDILVNNAGIVQWAAMPELDADILARHLAVHVFGSFHTTRAAWPRMVDQAYGRIVMTTSTGVFGLPNNTAYATAKAAVIGLARSLALTGAPHGIRVNCLAPGAMTRMAGRGRGSDEPDAAPEMSPDLVAPMVAFLAHEDCPVTGEVYAAGFGRFARVFLAVTDGYVHPTPEPTVEDVARHWAEVSDETGFHVPADLTAWSDAFLAHLQPRGDDRTSS